MHVIILVSYLRNKPLPILKELGIVEAVSYSDDTVIITLDEKEYFCNWKWLQMDERIKESDYVEFTYEKGQI